MLKLRFRTKLLLCVDHGCSLRFTGSAGAGLISLGERGDDADEDRIRLVVLVRE